MQIKPYDRQAAVSYAKEWALKRNPVYYNFDRLGGDCTNFASQCVYAGSGIMNHKQVFGWYYYSAVSRTPSWTGVAYFSNFLCSNKGQGPFGEISDRYHMEPGDVIQLGNDEGEFYHTLIVVAVDSDEIYIAAHTADAYLRPLSSYQYAKERFIKLQSVRT